MAGGWGLVTGASHGVGRAIATYLARRGMNLILTARSGDALAAVAAELKPTKVKLHLQVADLSAQEGRELVVAAAAAAVGSEGLQVYVHCAASQVDPEVEQLLVDTDRAQSQAHLEVTAAATAHLLAGLKPTLAAGAPSHAILISSDWALEHSSGPPVFSAAKAFGLQLWRTARAEFLKESVRLTAILPGDIASFDKDWEEPVWGLDDPVAQVQSELGDSRIALIDIVETVGYVVDRKLAIAYEIRLAPLASDYTY